MLALLTPKFSIRSQIVVGKTFCFTPILEMRLLRKDRGAKGTCLECIPTVQVGWRQKGKQLAQSHTKGPRQ